MQGNRTHKQNVKKSIILDTHRAFTQRQPNKYDYGYLKNGSDNFGISG